MGSMAGLLRMPGKCSIIKEKYRSDRFFAVPHLIFIVESEYCNRERERKREREREREREEGRKTEETQRVTAIFSTIHYGSWRSSDEILR